MVSLRCPVLQPSAFTCVNYLTDLSIYDKYQSTGPSDWIGVTGLTQWEVIISLS
jgi:hypothetical protein